MFKPLGMYHVYAKKGDTAPLESCVFVQDGFSWPAFLLNALWALYHRLWLLAALVICAETLVFLLLQEDILSREMILAVRLVFYMWIGFEASAWREAGLEKQGYVLFDVVSGRTEADAWQRFFDRYAGYMTARAPAYA